MKSSRSSFVLAYILGIFTSQSIASYTFIRKDHVFEDCKIVSKCDNETHIYNASFITTDSVTGTVKVIVPRTLVESPLTLNSQEDGQICKNDSDPGFDYSIYNCEMPFENETSDCSYHEIILRYLFTSCYALYDSNYHRLAIGSVQTNYTNLTLKEDCSYKVDVELLQERYTLISINIRPFLYNTLLRLFVTDRECMPAPENDDFWWKVEVKEDQNDNVITEKNETQNRTVDCSIVLNEEIGLNQLRCVIDWTDILCIMIMREKTNNPINDEFCANISHIPIGQLRPYDSIELLFPAANLSRTTKTLFLVFIPLAVVAYVCVRLYFSDTKDHLFIETGSDSSKISPCVKCKVLFLYPQDCDSFMDIMKSLQKFLHNFNYFEVYDYFDPKRFGEIACDPQGWIIKLLSQKDVKIILAETDTAVLHQLAIAKKCVVNYVSPLPYSNLFTYSLQNLLHSLRPQEYNRIFLIRFEEISQDKGNLKLSRYQRYKLPEHLRNLISSMSNCNIIPFKELEESIEMQRLKHSIDKFRQYQLHNPSYHAEICNNLTTLI